MAGYLVPQLSGLTLHRTQELIKRSRFITSLGYADSAQAARDFIERIRQEFPDATHNCWAFAAGAAGDTAHVGYSDDGEPHGTAGRPMLTVLAHSGIGHIAAVVTRYFGGVKLGTGGLVRAYQGALATALESLPTCPHTVPVYLELHLAYPHITLFLRLVADFDAHIEHEEFATEATYRVSLPQERQTDFCLALRELSFGTARIRELAASSRLAP